MLREHYLLFKRLHLTVDLLAVSACFVGCRLAFETTARQLSVPDLFLSPALMIPLSILGLILGTGTRAYEYRLRRLPSVLGNVVRAWIISVALTIVIIFAFPQWSPSRPMFLSFALAALAMLALCHSAVWLALNLYRRSGRSYKNVIIVGTGLLARSTADEILAHPGRGLRILGFLDWDTERRLWRYRDIPVIGTLADLPTIGKSQQVDKVIFAVGYKILSKISAVVGTCNRMGLPAIVLTDILGDIPVRKAGGEFFGRPGVQFDTAPRRHWAVTAKILADRVLAFVALFFLAPLFAGIALAIKLDSTGPIFFRQERVGLHGRKFTLWKFRTMIADAEQEKAGLAALNEMSGPVFKISNDPRVTRVGRFLRRTSIDELVQLINVVRGDMSLVGPRPPLPDEVVRYDGWERRRLSVKPGLTCLWQINGRNEIDFERWMKLDLEYIDNWSLRKDAAILIKTIPAVLRGTGAR